MVIYNQWVLQEDGRTYRYESKYGSVLEWVISENGKSAVWRGEEGESASVDIESDSDGTVYLSVSAQSNHSYTHGSCGNADIPLVVVKALLDRVFT